MPGWHSNDSFGVDDLLGLAKLADQTHTWLVQKQQGPEITGPSRDLHAARLPPGGLADQSLVSLTEQIALDVYNSVSIQGLF